MLFRENFPVRVPQTFTFKIEQADLSDWSMEPFYSLDRSMTIIDGHGSESFVGRTSDKASPHHKEQAVLKQPSERNIDVRPVVTVDNSLLIKIMARLKNSRHSPYYMIHHLTLIRGFLGPSQSVFSGKKKFKAQKHIQMFSMLRSGFFPA